MEKNLIRNKELIEQRLNELLQGSEELYVAARHSTLAPAKRIRPLLILAGCESYGVPLEQALDPACALEFIHTYSLIHDDLPSMDDDDFRRGLPTLHRLYDEATAILVGDYLLTYSFEILSKTQNLDAEKRIALIRVFSQAAGADGLVGGQLLDLRADPDIQHIHKLKTASLFKAAMECVAVLADIHQASTLQTLGIYIGMLFQLIDDLEDHDHPYGDSAAASQSQQLYIQCHQLISNLPNPEPIEQILRLLYTKLNSLIARS